MPSMSTRATSGRVNSGGGASPRASIPRTLVPYSATRSSGPWGHVLGEAMAPHARQ